MILHDLVTLTCHLITMGPTQNMCVFLCFAFQGLGSDHWQAKQVMNLLAQKPKDAALMIAGCTGWSALHGQGLQK